MDIMNEDLDRLMASIDIFEALYGSHFTLYTLEAIARSLQIELEEGKSNDT